MVWEIKPARDAFSAFTPEWDRLNAEFYGAHPMLDSRFVGPLLTYFSDGSEQLCIHRTSSIVDGALILCPIGFGRWKLFLRPQTQIGAILVRDARLIENIFGTLPGFAWTIDLLCIDPDFSPNWTGLRLPRIIMPHVQTMSVALEGDFDSYWRSRPRNLIKNIRRYQGRIERSSTTPSFATISDTIQLNAAVARYGALETSGWKGKAGTAISIDNVQGKFYRAALEAFAASSQAMVTELYIGDRLIASRLIIHNRIMWVILKTTYDEAMAAVAPGRQLLYATLQMAFSDQQRKSVEFYTNANRDQAEWATSLRYIHHHQIYRSDLSAAMHGFAKTMRHLFQRKAPEPETKTIAKSNQPSIKSSLTIQDLSADALRLMNDAACNNLEFSAQWFENMQQTVFTNDPGIRYFVSEADTRCTAILPLRLVRRGWLRSVESLSNYYTSLYAPILAKESSAWDIVPLLEKSIEDQGGAHVMRFSPLDPAASAYEALLTALRCIGWVPFRFFCFGNWCLKVDKPWLEYLKGRNGTLRSTIKRMGKKFAAAGGTLEIVTDPVGVEPAITAYTNVYAHSWKKPEPYPDFVPNLIRKLAQGGHLRLGIAWLNGRPIAAQIWTVAGGKACIFKLAYDEGDAKLAAGTLLTAHLMEHVIERDGVSEVDYLIGDDEYKKTWMSHRRERWGIVAYNPKTLTGLALLVREVLGRTLNGQKMIYKLVWRFYPAADFATLAPKWQALCDATIGTPLLSADFVSTALRHFGRGDELICIAEGPQGPVAGAILQRKSALIWQTFQPSQMPLGPWLQPAGMDFAVVSQSLLLQMPWPAMVLAVTQQDPDFYARPANAMVVALDSITTGRTTLAPDMDKFMRSDSVKENPKLLSELMRRMRKAEKDHGKITLEKETTTEAAGEFVGQYAATESRGWKGAAGTALSPNDLQSKFYSELMQQFAKRGAARMYTLKFGDTPVARQIAVAGENVLILLKTTYEPEYRSLGPGVILQNRLMEDVHKTEPALKIIELYGPFNDSQKLWVSGTRTIYHANIYRWRLLADMHRRWMDARNRRDLSPRAVERQTE